MEHSGERGPAVPRPADRRPLGADGDARGNDARPHAPEPDEGRGDRVPDRVAVPPRPARGASGPTTAPDRLGRPGPRGRTASIVFRAVDTVGLCVTPRHRLPPTSRPLRETV